MTFAEDVPDDDKNWTLSGGGNIVYTDESGKSSYYEKFFGDYEYDFGSFSVNPVFSAYRHYLLLSAKGTDSKYARIYSPELIFTITPSKSLDLMIDGIYSSGDFNYVSKEIYSEVTYSGEKWRTGLGGDYSSESYKLQKKGKKSSETSLSGSMSETCKFSKIFSAGAEFEYVRTDRRKPAKSGELYTLTANTRIRFSDDFSASVKGTIGTDNKNKKLRGGGVSGSYSFLDYLSFSASYNVGNYSITSKDKTTKEKNTTSTIVQTVSAGITATY
jgi:hypothetical protein